MQRNITEFDVIFLSYDEPNSEELYADLSNKIPWAKRISNIKGFDSAHRACADISETDFFVTVDGDNIVHQDFLDVTIDINTDQKDHAWTWASRNFVNGLVYGNGGLKLWSKEFVYSMNSHENAIDDTHTIDFCWNKKYHDVFGCYSTSVINSTPYQAFRAGFREGVKMSLDRGQKVQSKELVDVIWVHNLHKLLIWCSIGSDVENGIWAIYGARLGTYMCNLTDWDYRLINNYDWFLEFWKTIEHKNPGTESTILGKNLVSQLGLNLADFTAQQSKFFKSVYINPNKNIMTMDIFKHLVSHNV